MVLVSASIQQVRTLVRITAVAAIVWGLLAITSGAYRMYIELRQYRWERALLSSPTGNVGSSSLPHLPVPILLIGPVLDLFWVAVTAAWLVLATVQCFGSDRPHRAKAYLGAVVLITAVAVVDIVARIRAGLAEHPYTVVHVHLLTPDFVYGALLALDGLFAFAITAWVSSGRASGGQPHLGAVGNGTPDLSRSPGVGDQPK